MMKILVADDHALFRAGLRLVVHQLEAEMLEAHDWQSARAALEAQPDIALALVDLSMPGRDRFAGLGDLLECAETVPVVVVSASESVLDMKRVLDMGAVGYLAKSETAAVMLNAMRLALAGGVYVPPKLVLVGKANGFGLTARQVDILRALVQGKSNKIIAQDFDLSVATVKAHVGAIFRALNVNSRADAVRVIEKR
ncbi:MAG: response regulator transcription factor [Gallionellaceae bacterium]|nr:response regulator transcription factor [Gallionellaceae bacterium]